MIIGFTGTQKGMTEAQREAFKSLLAGWSFFSFHHGCCVGADDQANSIVRSMNIRTEGHPPINTTKLAGCEVDFLWLPKEYLQRNKDIVHMSSRMIATPDTFHEKLRSGTWSTIRYAKKNHIPVWIIFPDGS